MALWQTVQGGSDGCRTQRGVGTPVEDPDPRKMSCERLWLVACVLSLVTGASSSVTRGSVPPVILRWGSGWGVAAVHTEQGERRRACFYIRCLLTL